MNAGKSDSHTMARIIGVLFAVILWFYVTSTGTFQYKVTLPIEYVGPSDEYILASSVPGETQVLLEGTGRELFAYTMQQLFDIERRYALVNLTGLPVGENRVELQPDDINLAIEGIRVQNILYPSNGRISLVIDRRIRRTVPVSPDSLLNIEIADGFIPLGPPRPDPEFVLLEGAENRINALTSVHPRAATRRVVTAKDSVVTAGVSLPDFVRATPEEITLRFTLDVRLTRTIEGVPVRAAGFPRDMSPRFDPDSLSVEITGPAGTVSALSPDDFEIRIPYRLYTRNRDDGSLSMEPDVRYPASITAIRLIPPRIRLDTTNN